MQTLSSASLTCMASASAVECTATVAMPSSFAARKIRSAISPRLAMRILSNIGSRSVLVCWRLAGASQLAFGIASGRREAADRRAEPLLDHKQRFPVLLGGAVLDEDRRHGAGARGDDLVEALHGLDEQHLLAG